MPHDGETWDAGSQARRRLYVYNGGFLTQRRIRRILELAGYDVRIGLPKTGDLVGAWGHSPTAHRAEKIAAQRSAQIVRVEDAFLRSVLPGRAGGGAPLGLTLDHGGMHYDPAQPSDLERLLATHPLDDSALMDRARGAIARIKEAHLTKYTGFLPGAPCPAPGYVLVLDQTEGDASVTKSGADRARFLEMLVYAQEEHPGKQIVIKTHPETALGQRSGHFRQSDATARITLLSDPVSPWALLDGAAAVYTVSSQLGFEAIFAGHKPRVFGQPFYAGWGLTQDDAPLPRRTRRLSRAQLFAAAMILYPKWYDPYRDRLCTLEDALSAFEAQTRAWREDSAGWIGSGLRLWKRRHMQQFFGRTASFRFSDTPAVVETAVTSGKRHMVWASAKSAPRLAASVQVEDGFLRSRGLGANLVPPLSLVLDDLGIYYDPTQPSRLERLIAGRADLRADQRARAQRLRAALIAQNLSKYNIGQAAPPVPDGHRVLVPGQVEDDASIALGTQEITTNLGLLQAARAANPSAVLLYKPHPDVEARLRPGAVSQRDLEALGAIELQNVSAAQAIGLAQGVWTMTSLLGFEALIRGVPVTCAGTPFYAGWGLTRDLGTVPERRNLQISLESLVHAVLIDYPRYHDPKTGLACPVEVTVDRLQAGGGAQPPVPLRALAKLQGALASQAHLWRR